VVEDFMIAANVAAAKALESKVAPVVYRIHEPPNREKLWRRITSPRSSASWRWGR
jgi:exoribonuclease R